MNLDIFRSDNKTGKFSREKWVMENYTEEWKHITKWGYPRIYNAGNKKWIKYFS